MPQLTQAQIDKILDDEADRIAADRYEAECAEAAHDERVRPAYSGYFGLGL